MALRKVASVDDYVYQLGKLTCVRREILAGLRGRPWQKGRAFRFPIRLPSDGSRCLSGIRPTPHGLKSSGAKRWPTSSLRTSTTRNGK
jgi:hypothetical protein